MNIISNSKYPAILIISDISSNSNYILKIPKNGDDEDEYEIINYEYSIYNLIKHPSFKSFHSIYKIVKHTNNIFVEFDDQNLKLPNITINVKNILKFIKNSEFLNKLYILVGDYNPNMITVFDYRYNTESIETIVDVYNEILLIKEECYVNYGFVHGDFKTNNILIDKTNISNIQFIDFEFTIIFANKKTVSMDDAYFINLYLQMPDDFEITDEFGRLFDIYLLCAEIYNNYNRTIELVEYIKNIFITPKLKYINKSFVDFYIILINLQKIDKKEFYDKETKCINMRFESICKNLSNIQIPPNSIGLVKNRVIHIDTVLKNLEL
jgi:hypothetical protein